MIFLFLLFPSCNNTEEINDGGLMIDTNSAHLRMQDSMSKIDSAEISPIEHLSKSDSIKVSDSVKRTKNPVRDFN